MPSNHVIRGTAFDFDHDVLSISHHPTKPQFSAALVTGHLLTYSYDPSNIEKKDLLWSTKRHKKACRVVSYSPDGESLISVGADNVIKRAAFDSGKVLQKWTDCHEDTMNALQWINQHVFCTGDDAGVIKAWDIRKSTDAGAVRTFVTHDDYISSLLGIDEKFVLSTSGDGTLAVHDLRTSSASTQKDRENGKKSKALIKQSDDQEDDLTCSVILKSGSKKPKICIGTSSGVISIFNKGDYGDCNDRILPPRSADTSKRGKKGNSKKSAGTDNEIGVECMIKLDENRVIVGGADGKIRLLQVLPNQYLALLADFETGEPVQDSQVSGDWLFAASGNQVRVWPTEPPNIDPVEIDTGEVKKTTSGESDALNDQEAASSGDEQDELDDDDDDDDDADVNENDDDDQANHEDNKDGIGQLASLADSVHSDSDSDASNQPKRKKPKKLRPILENKRNTFFDDM